MTKFLDENHKLKTVTLKAILKIAVFIILMVSLINIFYILKH